MLADHLDYVIGVDTHRDEHVLAVVTAPAGTVVAGEAVHADARGYRATLRFAGRYAPGQRAWAIEGSGSYGAGLARYPAEHGETVLEVSRTPRAERRLRGKDDPLDAARTAVAAQLIVAWSHRGRLRSEAAFARLAGVAPVPASSGKTTRHRLSRGGDRQLNRALHTIVLHRRQHDPPTRDYIARRSPTAKPVAKRPASSSATSPATSTDYCDNSR